MEADKWAALDKEARLKLFPHVKPEWVQNDYDVVACLNKDRQRHLWYNDKNEYEYLLTKYKSNNRHEKDDGNHTRENTFDQSTAFTPPAGGDKGGDTKASKPPVGKRKPERAKGLFD